MPLRPWAADTPRPGGAIALEPVGGDPLGQPSRRRLGQAVQRGPQRLADCFQPVEPADGGQDVGGIGALPATGLHQPSLLEPNQQSVQQQRFLFSFDQSAPELTQHGIVEARIGEIQTEGVLPIDSPAHSIGRLSIGQILQKLQHRYQRQPPWCRRRLASLGVQGGEQFVLVDRPQLVAEAENGIALGKGSPRDGRGIIGHRRNGLRLERHDRSPCIDDVTSTAAVPVP